MTNEHLVNILLGVVGFLLVTLLKRLEKGNETLVKIELEIARLNVTVHNYDKEIATIREWNHSQDKEILKLRERQHELADKIQQALR